MTDIRLNQDPHFYKKETKQEHFKNLNIFPENIQEENNI